MAHNRVTAQEVVKDSHSGCFESRVRSFLTDADDESNRGIRLTLKFLDK